MEDIRSLVHVVVAGCREGGVDVSEVLAAFIARTVIESSSVRFAVNREMSPHDASEVIMRSIERLLERDNPQLETIKMQVFYDEALANGERSMRKVMHHRAKLIASHMAGVFELADTATLVDGDFETLTRIYRKVFRLVVDFSPASKQGRAVEKEVAAALESVFPRVGLKAFVQLSNDDKKQQLNELGKIITGIRVLNKFQGRGSGGLDDVEGELSALSAELLQAIETAQTSLQEQCSAYHAAIIRTYLSLPKHEGPESVCARKEALLLATRWSHELANKRQRTGLLSALHQQIKTLMTQGSELLAVLHRERDAVHALVSGKDAVPKEDVYPRFNALGDVFVGMFEVLLAVRGKQELCEGLTRLDTSFVSTLPGGTHPLVRALEEHETSEAAEAIRGIPSVGEGGVLALAETRAAGVDSACVDASEELAQTEPTEQGTLLSMFSTEDFLNLPLEMQGYCPWTIVHSRGLLIPGKPALGVVSFRDRYYVCEHEVALHAMLSHPQQYLDQVKEHATANPEFIHLLKLQRWFPHVNISRLMATSSREGEQSGDRTTQDASTETVLHLQDKYMDPNYHWNEWELRRRALQAVHLQHCATKGQQTDDSHFRRDNQTMLYIQRPNWTQTKRSKGTNPPIKTTFVAGLRGKVETSVSRFVDVRGLAPEEALKPRVVTLTLDL